VVRGFFANKNVFNKMIISAGNNGDLIRLKPGNLPTTTSGGRQFNR
jgi:hypothetical protein